MIKLIFVMGCGWGYRFYRNKNEREGPVLYFCFSILIWVSYWFSCSGVFWGGIRYSLHVFSVR
jgi:hypothetical protein